MTKTTYKENAYFGIYSFRGKLESVAIMLEQ